VTVRGTYVRTFDDATFALPDGMHMNADYPFMLPKIVARSSGSITIEGRGGERETLKIHQDARGQEFCELVQSSTFERLYDQPPTKFKLMPFKGEEW
jgi:hypothetical protein